MDFSILDTINLIKKINKKDLKLSIDKNRIRPHKSEVTRLISNNKKQKSCLIGAQSLRKKGFELGLKN